MRIKQYKKILFIYRTPRKLILQNVKKGQEPSHTLYGASNLEGLNYKINFTDVSYSKLNILKWLFLPFEKWIIKVTSLGFKLDQALLLLPFVWRNDLIITTVDSAGLPILLLKKIGLFNKPVIFISIGLINEINNRRSKYISKFYLELLDQASFIVCHSPIEKKLFEKLNSKLKDKLRYIPFGIDSNFFHQKRKISDFILSIGQDRSRDYRLLSELSYKMGDQKFVVITQKSNVKGISFNTNVKLYYNLPYSKVRWYFLRSKLVILPLKELKRASGQVSFLEALASGNKVVVAHTQGIHKTYPNILKNDLNIFSYKVGDIVSLQSITNKALNSKFKKFDFPYEYTINNYTKNLDILIKAL